MRRVPGYIFAALFSLLALIACGQGEKGDVPAPPAEQEVLDLYNLYVKGDYVGYVNAMHSCEKKTDDYRAQMVMLHKQHAAKAKAANGGVKSVALGRLEMHDGGKMANAFINVSYNNNETEEIIFPLVYADGKWKIR